MHGREKSELRHSSCEADEQIRSNPLRSRWSQGRRPREMRASKARAGRSTGKACHRRWNAYDKPQGKGRRRSSLRSSTISPSTCLRTRLMNSRRTPLLAWMVGHGRSTMQTSSGISRICMSDFIGERTGRYRAGGCIYQSRTVDSVRSRSPHSKTKSSKERRSRC